jgi:hypothetical protein
VASLQNREAEGVKLGYHFREICRTQAEEPQVEPPALNYLSQCNDSEQPFINQQLAYLSAAGL